MLEPYATPSAHVLQTVYHSDRAVDIDPATAAAIVAVTEAGLIERQAATAAFRTDMGPLLSNLVLLCSLAVQSPYE